MNRTLCFLASAAPRPRFAPAQVRFFAAAGGRVRVIEKSDQFSAALKENKPVMAYFTATWCPPCRMIAPVYEKLSTQYTQAEFLKIDVDEHEDLAAQNRVSAMPTFLLFKDGQEKGKVVGADAAKIEQLLKTHTA
eukprot:GILI01008929.1.p1 GENE.GILI01008929.1~~GILI01008929.1.p1  ORF type:complete len:153 (+),score=53.19 GILI01008929.1:56-460(+)